MGVHSQGQRGPRKRRTATDVRLKRVVVIFGGSKCRNAKPPHRRLCLFSKLARQRSTAMNLLCSAFVLAGTVRLAAACSNDIIAGRSLPLACQGSGSHSMGPCKSSQCQVNKTKLAAPFGQTTLPFRIPSRPRF